MSSIAANAGPERTNRWLLIAGVALALITGVLVFAAVSSMGDDTESSSSVPTGDTDVLVAKDTISPGTELNADMFRVATFAEDDLVPDHMSNPQAVVGQTTTVEILKGQQLSRTIIASATEDDRADQLPFKLPDGHRAIGVSVDKVTTYGGLAVPGDRVDVVVTFDEKDSNGSDAQKYKRISTVLQNVLVVAREQVELERINTLPADADEDGGAVSATEDDINIRPDDVETDRAITVVTLALIPEDVQRLVLADSLGEVTLSLRKFGEDSIAPIEDVRVPIYE